jgi:hypothetical protein
MHHTDELADGAAILEHHALHLHRALGFGRRRGLGLTAGEEKRGRERDKRALHLRSKMTDDD